MQLIRSVEVRRFRSIDHVVLQDLSDFTILVGPNNSGKSNILRSLNLFFNDWLERNTYLDFDRDYFTSAPSKKRKEISVTVEFEWPSTFNLRSDQKAIRAYLGEKFSLRKTWTPKTPYDPLPELNRDGSHWEQLSGDGLEKAQQFLKLISFRYIQNRAVPAEIIREEWSAIRRELARRVANYAPSAGPLFANIKKFADSMVEPIGAEIKRWAAGIEQIELATPQGLADMLAPSIFRAAIGSGAKVEDTSLGSGVQAILMFSVLHDLVDKSEFRDFGWKQGAVWAVEEPESSLHRDLQMRLAAQLRSYTVSEGSRFQIISTTHNEIFVMSGTAGFSVTL
ncbi:MAG TPA: AAA family ATPase, partial [Thermoleophilia bacterium]|nr:AAA family ATPase [Thermoleophilia bacterium]